MALGPRISAPRAMDLFGALLSFHMLIMVGVGCYVGFKSTRLATEGEAAHATVVDMKVGSKGSGTPVVEFTTRKGERIRFEGKTSSRPHVYQVGEKITVLYLPSDPSEHAIQSFTEMWFFPTVFISLGLAATTGGVVMMVWGLRRKRDQRRVMAMGWHVQGVVVGVRDVGSSKSRGYEADVELRDPRTGEVLRAASERQTSSPIVGRPALVHIDAKPPHGYFVELG